MTELPRKITDDPYGAAILIRRLVMEQGVVFWRRYLTAFVLMGAAAGATAGSAYILGQVINQAYVEKNVPGIAILSGVTVVLLFIKGVATYGHTMILSKISNAILANNQRRLFAKLMNESIGFFSERHSSEFLARLTVLFDPGRIKRGLVPTTTIGPACGGRQALPAGDHREWKDARGVQLVEGFEKPFRGGPSDRVPPDPKNWLLPRPALAQHNLW